MKHYVVTAVLSLIVLSCDDSGGASNNSCADECLQAGAVMCNGDLIDRCEDQGGCLVWSTVTNCSVTGGTCDDALGTPKCTDSCVDLCDGVGETRCNGTRVQNCVEGGAGCLTWETDSDCALTEQACNDGSGQAACVEDCNLHSPVEPSSPEPQDQGVDVDPDLTTQLTWAASEGAVSYAVYAGEACPPPAWPDAAFVSVSDPGMPVSLAFETSYCWQVVAISEDGCETEGPVWSFETGTPCTEAPSCSGALAPPSSFTHFTSLDLVSTEIPPPPASLCHAPQLRMTLDTITVYEEVDDMANDAVYCIVTAEAPLGSAIQVTGVTQPLDEGESIVLPLNEGIVWGQNSTLTAAGGDMVITYDCFEQDDADEYISMLATLASASAAAGGVQGTGNGWIFTNPGAAASVSAQMIALNSSDDYTVHAQHTIPGSAQLELTHGYYWTVRQSGTINMSDYDYELTMKIWGCSDNGI